MWASLGLVWASLEGQGDLVSGLIIQITRVTIWVVGMNIPLPKFP